MDNFPWIHSKRNDLLFIFAPSFLCIFIIFTLWAINIFPSDEGNWRWLFIIVFIDVGHVWSTIFRTYLHKEAFENLKKHLVILPLFCFTFFSSLYFYSDFIFWRVMAYLALFHFMRQQVGFLNIYLRKYNPELFHRRFSTLVLWLTMLIPVLDWHFRHRDFTWFMEGDFFSLNLPDISHYLWISFFIIYSLYIVYEIKNIKKDKIAANLHILLTLGIWGGGISFLNNEFAFTLTNVVHHGIPYIALVWMSSLNIKEYQAKPKLLNSLLYKSTFLKFISFIVIILSFAIFEEYLWDIFVWHEREGFFPLISFVELDPIFLSLVVGLLSTPQTTHYLLDGFIWKRENQTSSFHF